MEYERIFPDGRDMPFGGCEGYALAPPVPEEGQPPYRIDPCTYHDRPEVPSAHLKRLLPHGLHHVAYVRLLRIGPQE